MLIRDGAKSIVRYMLEKVLSVGSIYEKIFIHYDSLTKELGLESENYCRVCFQYLHEFQYINIIRNDNGSRLVKLTAKGIDFLESM